MRESRPKYLVGRQNVGHVYLVDCQEAVKGLLATELLHIRGDIVSPVSNDLVQLLINIDFGVVKSDTAIPFSDVKVFGHMPLDLSLDPLLALFVDVVCVVVVVIDGEVAAVLDELVQLAQSCLTASFQDVLHQC